MQKINVEKTHCDEFAQKFEKKLKNKKLVKKYIYNL